MVLNHASALNVGVEQSQVVEWLQDIAVGMAKLVNGGIVGKTLRMEKAFPEIECLPDFSLYCALQSLRASGHRDEYIFIQRLTNKLPLLGDLEKHQTDRFLGCEDLTFSDMDGTPLLLCAITNWVAISMPSKPYWKKDKIKIQFKEILPNEQTEITFEDVDQLSGRNQAKAICMRYWDSLRAGTDPREIWEKRHSIFPNLDLAPGVENDLVQCANVIGTVVGKLSALDNSAKLWDRDRGPRPIWQTMVSPESVERMRNEQFRNSRTFRSHDGTQKLFEWHARFGNSGRIHLRFDTNSFKVEIGYIGPHL